MLVRTLLVALLLSHAVILSVPAAEATPCNQGGGIKCLYCNVYYCFRCPPNCAVTILP